MRFARTFVLAFFSLLFAFPVFAQQPSTSTTQSSPQALALLQKSLAALTGGQSITDVTLTGTARRIAGSDDESGTATVKALAGTGARLDLNLSSGPRSELRNTAGTAPVGSWSDPGGVSHAMPGHNLLTDPGWFPAFALSSLLSAPNAVITYIAPETRDGQSVIHISAVQQFPTVTGDLSTLLRHLSQTEVFLDATTLLPTAVVFNIHPDNNANVDIPTELDYSGYQPISGAQIPLHVQKLINNSLVLDLQFGSAVLNSGLSASTFALEGGL